VKKTPAETSPSLNEQGIDNGARKGRPCQSEAQSRTPVGINRHRKLVPISAKIGIGISVTSRLPKTRIDGE
jgi:hypothetical protein